MFEKIYVNQTKNDVRIIAQKVAQSLSKGDIILLNGNLGTGKTFFTKKLCGFLEVKDPVNSPSYVLLNEYTGKYKILHYDLFRISLVEEALALGVLDKLTEGITIIEWPEIIKEHINYKYIEMLFKHNGKNRDISLKYIV